jgi:amino acid transporter
VSAEIGNAGAPVKIETSLHRGTNWWGAFVIGLAGTILVTGIVPFAVSAMGAAAIPAIAIVVVIGFLLCVCMAELGTLFPHRTGGIPSFANESFKRHSPTAAKHIGGFASWSYWIGWFPVAPINMLLTASYVAVLFHLPLGRTILPLGSIGAPVNIGVLIITVLILSAIFIPCYLGIRLGAGFATLLGIASMVPITLLILLPIFRPSSFHWSNISGFHFIDPKTAGFVFFMAWVYVISWNALAMEAAACYVGECRDPHRDAKIALTAEGAYGVFIYIATAIVFVGVLGAALKSSDPLTLYTSFADHIFGSAGWVKYLIGIPLIFALILSVLNAIMGVARSLFQASEDGVIPRWFMHKNKHHVPDRAMAFNVVCACLVALVGSPVRIYVFSNVGYLIAIITAFISYFVVRQFQKDMVAPFRLPGVFKWLALAGAGFITFEFVIGGWNSTRLYPGATHSVFILGFAIVLAYVPLYIWRQVMDKRLGLTTVPHAMELSHPLGKGVDALDPALADEAFVHPDSAAAPAPTPAPGPLTSMPFAPTEGDL